MRINFRLVAILVPIPITPLEDNRALKAGPRMLLGAEAEDELGFSVASGDVNGDGRDDIIGGALLADGPDNARPDAGEAYVILSAP